MNFFQKGNKNAKNLNTDGCRLNPNWANMQNDIAILLGYYTILVNQMAPKKN